MSVDAIRNLIPGPRSAGHPVGQSKKSDSWLRGYVLLALLIVCGYLWRDQRLINPESGVGYWLGVTGAISMLLLLLYPVRKRIRWLNRYGSTRVWFHTHMLLGLIGPLLILFHSNFNLGSFNSRVAIFSMLLVAGSGIVGRHFYARIHRGLYGRKTSLAELQVDLETSKSKNQGLSKFTPLLIERLNAMSAELDGCEITKSLGIGPSLKWTFTHHVAQVSLLLLARRELKQAARESVVIERN